MRKKQNPQNTLFGHQQGEGGGLSWDVAERRLIHHGRSHTGVFTRMLSQAPGLGGAHQEQMVANGKSPSVTSSPLSRPDRQEEEFRDSANQAALAEGVLPAPWGPLKFADLSVCGMVSPLAPG